MEFEICGNCNGSGEGQYEGTHCYICHGTGAVGRSSDGMDTDENINGGDGGTDNGLDEEEMI